MAKLTMHHFLRVVAEHRTNATDVLAEEGWHPAVITAKAEKASRKGYTDYGIVVDRPWLTDKGSKFLAED